MNETKLKLCPFCGSGNVYIETHWQYLPNETTYGVVCDECQSRSSHLYESKLEAVEAWNTRHEPPTPGGAIVPAGNDRLGGYAINEYKKIVQETLTERDLLEQLAEEAAELSQAALKLIRASGMNKNATPIRKEEAAENLLDELRDVLIVAEALGIWLGDHRMDSHKWQRWAERVANNG